MGYDTDTVMDVGSTGKSEVLSREQLSSLCRQLVCLRMYASIVTGIS